MDVNPWNSVLCFGCQCYSIQRNKMAASGGMVETLQANSAVVIGVVLGVAGVVLVRKYFGGGVCRSNARLDGKTVVITGANTGIGKETARDIARRGARVIVACRDLAKAEAAAEEIRKDTGNGNVVVEKLDLASLKSVREFAAKANGTESRLDILINNAGIMTCPQWKTEDGFEMQFGTNHLGHFLLTNLLLDKLKTSAPSRVVNVASSAHYGGHIHFDDINLEKSYGPIKAYCQSKLANVLFTKELDRRMKGKGVTTYSLHPGGIHTELQRHLDASYGWLFYLLKPVFFAGLVLFGKTPRQGAQTTIHCAVSEGLETSSGLYFTDCAPKEPIPEAKDEAVAKKLWELSEEMVGLK
ncbi:retinol dehydrogenase 12-like [Branchiostoma floridae x Branchiostoma belcheri]